jgi:hypothetical protein
VNVQAGTIDWQLQIFNLPSGATAGHIHVGADGVAGPTLLNFPIPPTISNDFALSGTFTSADLTLRPEQGIRSFQDCVQAILGGTTYVNVHTQVNPAGEIRGQLTVDR